MTAAERLLEVVKDLPEETAREVLDFTEFLLAKSEDEEWHAFTRRGFAKAFGDNEPEYTLDDVIRR